MKKDYIFSIDLGGTSTKLAIINDDGQFIHKWEIPTDISENGRMIVPNIAQSFSKEIEKLQIPKERFLGVGMGAPGPVVRDGVISRAVNLGWEQFPLKSELEKHLQLPSYVENDANCAAFGEMWLGSGKDLKNMICITLGTGVGGGIIVNGEIVSGSNGGGGEIGHMTVQPENGYRCNCGKNGCLETVASATGVVRLAMEKLSSWTENSMLKDRYDKTETITSKDVFEAKEAGDALAKEVVDQVAYYLGYAFGNIAALLNPEAIIVGGGVSKAGDTLLTPIKSYYDQFAFPPSKKDTNILLATLGNDAGVIGAAWLVKKNRTDKA
ncbi:ROK family glucokinase [Fervidibacillus halotolerans]|uniref:Glucokinase n=1 Tax=Fervidibacillus halotolerans TaxID=2980027 RepID=A0A9E8RW78_9BACI|nr:ROK family glucokinase [Fervidibacillus halotolerans]WAA11460.1 ROK family glucokinase [Fervidibacillus halotolerans]